MHGQPHIKSWCTVNHTSNHDARSTTHQITMHGQPHIRFKVKLWKCIRSCHRGLNFKWCSLLCEPVRVGASVQPHIPQHRTVYVCSWYHSVSVLFITLQISHPYSSVATLMLQHHDVTHSPLSYSSLQMRLVLILTQQYSDTSANEWLC